MQVTQCDRCGAMPITPKIRDYSAVERDDTGQAQYGVELSLRKGFGNTEPDLCKDCFWKIVRLAIDDIMAQEIKEATRA